MSTTTVACLFLLLAAVTTLVSALPVHRREADKDTTPVVGGGEDCLSSNCVGPPGGKRRRKSIDVAEEPILKSLKQPSNKRDEADRPCLGSHCRAPDGKRDKVRRMCLGWDCWQEDHDQGKRDADSAPGVTAKRAQPCDFGECEGPRNGKRNFDVFLRSLGAAETSMPPQPGKRGQVQGKRRQHQGKRGQQDTTGEWAGCPPWLCRDPSEIDDGENGTSNDVSE